MAAVLLAITAAACAPAGLRLPDGPSTPAPDARNWFEKAAAPCLGARTLTAEIGVSGRVAGRKLRGRVLAGFERPGALRLEAPAPFGAPIFILASRANRAVLLLPRDHRVVRDAPLEDVLEALTGIRRTSDDLLALLAGCLVADPRADRSDARQFRTGWASVGLEGGVEAFLRRNGSRWQIVAGRRIARFGGSPAGEWTVVYDDLSGTFPGTVRLSQAVPRQDAPGVAAELTLRVSQLETNLPIDPAAFMLRVPDDAVTMSIEDLRQMGPLADPDVGSRSRR